MLQTIPDADETTLRRSLGDVVALSTLTAIWTGAKPLRIAESLASALYTMMGARLVYVALNDPKGGVLATVAQTERGAGNAALAAELGPRLVDWVRTRDPQELYTHTLPGEDTPLRITCRQLGHNAEFGVIAAGFGDDNAPSPLHHLLLDVSATQATTGVNNALLMQTARQSEARVNLMVESAREYAMISIDPGGLISSWSVGAEQVFGGTAENMIGRPFAVIFTEEDRDNGVPQAELDRARDAGRSDDVRWHVRINGERFYANGVTSAMYDDHQRVSGFIKIARDTTGERNLQQNLVEARDAADVANIAKTEFLANMSHEIRTPMNAIIGLANLLTMSQPLTPRQREFIRTLQGSADSLLVLINDLLDISKIEARSVELEEIPFNLTQVVQEVASMMAVRVREKGLRFVGEGECVRERTFVGDPTRLRQIIVNLCSNAIKFTDEGSVHLEITCHDTEDPEVENICIIVKDTGVGIAPEKLGAIFQKFTQADASVNRKFGGTGLGLAISKTLAEIMGGDISVTSELGKGSIFTVCVPLRLAEEQITADPASVAEIIRETIEGKSGRLVLLVEDYEPNILVATSFLDSFGYQVRVARNGLEALEHVKAERFAAAIMDVQMHGMNGLEATQMIRSLEARDGQPRLPIIGMTAHALAGDRERCLAAGMDDYLSKPFHPEQLEAALRRAIRED